MKNVRFRLIFLILLSLAVISVEGQSNNVEFPTPVTSNTISGKIKARDIGDPRSTVYYYIFEASQGDVFIKIETSNLDGDIDIFYADNLRPLTKITLYADTSPTQTGREIYLRKPEKLILKVEGRTPIDDPALFSIKFEGSFKAMASKTQVEGKLPEVKSETDSESEVTVNSVGTIIAVKPKPTPTPRETIAKNTKSSSSKTTTTPEAVSTIKTPKTSTSRPKTKTEPKPERKVENEVAEDLPKKEAKEKVETAKEVEKEKAAKPKSTPKTTTSKNNTSTAKKINTPPKKETQPKVVKPNPAEELAKALENVRLIVEFKDGGKIERPMNDVVRFGVDKGYLTIVNKDGSIGRYSILEINKISVE